MDPLAIYQLLRTLTSPVVAITSEHGGKRNGMIIDSAIRASISPAVPRIAVFIHKFNFSHDLIFDSGRFGVHLLRIDQYPLIRRLGFVSGRTTEKLAGIAHHTGKLGLPVLEDCVAAFECRVVNAMDTGASTCFLGDVVHVEAREPTGEVMTATYFRANLPAEWRRDFEEQLRAAQQKATQSARPIRALTWRDLMP
jgi:flavin reductase (DIM6/NTAB) family NADH-FMN oxidoreductase RutF